MRFLIERTSQYGGDEKPPCEGCEREGYTHVDERTFSDPAQFISPAVIANWYERGSNHRVENGHIKRDMPAEGWFKEIGTLDELLEFMREHGELVLKPASSNPETPTIEIYDTWRE